MPILTNITAQTAELKKRLNTNMLSASDNLLMIVYYACVKIKVIVFLKGQKFYNEAQYKFFY